jgi:hypothetical protein
LEFDELAGWEVGGFDLEQVAGVEGESLHKLLAYLADTLKRCGDIYAHPVW